MVAHWFGLAPTGRSPIFLATVGVVRGGRGSQMPRRALLAAIAALVMVCAAPAVAGASSFVVGPHDQSVVTVDCYSFLSQAPHGDLAGDAYVGYVGNPDPTTGQAYYVALSYEPLSQSLSAANGGSCVSNQRVSMELALPQSTSLAISASNPVKCYYDGVAFTNGCPSGPNAGGSGWSATDPGYLRFDPSSTDVWNPDDGKALEIHVPVVSSAAFSEAFNYRCPNTGQGCLVGKVRMRDGFQDTGTSWAFYPEVGVTVTGQPQATVGYQATPTSSITTTGAHLNYTYSPNGVAGSQYAQLGSAASGGSCASPTSVQIKNQSSVAAGDNTTHNATATVTGLTAGAPYCWRAVFAPTSGSVVTGAWQAFTTGVQKYTLTVTNNGVSHYVYSDTGGIDCGSSQGAGSVCSAQFDSGTQVELFLDSDGTGAYEHYDGWSGACTGPSDSCVVTMNANKTVGASFSVPKYSSVTSLAASSNPAAAGSQVTYTATVTSPYQLGPRGTIKFTDDGATVSGCGAVEAQRHSDDERISSASCTTSYSLGGSHQIVAVYSGNDAERFDGSTSSALTETINDPPPPPNTKLDSAKIRSAKRRATFKFSSNEAGSSFLCKLDHKPYKSCDSPKTYRRLKNGKYTFKVEAKNSAGVLDPSPAKKKFEING
jgi:hypothetical protein